MKQSLLYTLLPLSSILFISSCKDNEEVKNKTIVELPEGTVIDTAKLKELMIDFRASLSDDLLANCSNKLDSNRFYKWHNTPANKRGKRDGIKYQDLSEKQIAQFKSMMQHFLSKDGYQKVYEITVLSEGWLEKIQENVWNRGFYSIDLFGDPEKSDAWGVQLDGHHCVINFLVQGDTVSIVPAFLGAEPAVETHNGEHFDIFKDERDFAVTLYNGFSQQERSSAVINTTERGLQVGPPKKPGDPDPFIGDYDYSEFKTGLKYSDMSETSQQNLIKVMKEYVYNVRHHFADTWWKDIESNIDETYFVWVHDGDTVNGESLFY